MRGFEMFLTSCRLWNFTTIVKTTSRRSTHWDEWPEPSTSKHTTSMRPLQTSHASQLSRYWTAWDCDKQPSFVLASKQVSSSILSECCSPVFALLKNQNFRLQAKFSAFLSAEFSPIRYTSLPVGRNRWNAMRTSQTTGRHSLSYPLLEDS